MAKMIKVASIGNPRPTSELATTHKKHSYLLLNFEFPKIAFENSNSLDILKCLELNN